jgi:hypothetical protein
MPIRRGRITPINETANIGRPFTVFETGATMVYFAEKE